MNKEQELEEILRRKEEKEYKKKKREQEEEKFDDLPASMFHKLYR